VTKIVAGQEMIRKALVPAPIVENGSLLVSDADYVYIATLAFRSGEAPGPAGWLADNIKWFN
jgi:hypothetical protein